MREPDLPATVEPIPRRHGAPRLVDPPAAHVAARRQAIRDAKRKRRRAAKAARRMQRG